MKSIFISLVIFISLGSFAQGTDSIPKPEFDSVLKAFIKGQQNSNPIDIDFIRQGFELGLTDSTYKIKSFFMCWDDPDGDIYCFKIDGGRVAPEGRLCSLRKAGLRSFFSFESIVVIKNGKEFGISPFVVNAADIFKRHLTINNPRICHNEKKYLTCYNDGNNIFNFRNGFFTRFSTTDSLIKYEVKNKTIQISKLDSTSNPIAIRLLRKSIEIECGDQTKVFDSIPTSIINVGGFNIQFFHSDIDSMSFSVSNKTFYFRIFTFYKTWSWEIVEVHRASLFFITHNYKTNRPDIISLKDDSYKYGTSIYLRRNGRIFHLGSNYIDRYYDRDHWVITTIPPQDSYHFNYNRFGKIKSKESNRSINCSCQ